MSAVGGHNSLLLNSPLLSDGGNSWPDGVGVGVFDVGCRSSPLVDVRPAAVVIGRSSPKCLVAKHGFKLLDDEREDYECPNELRNLRLLTETDDGQRSLYVSADYLLAWNDVLHRRAVDQQLTVVRFPAGKSQLDAVLDCVLPPKTANDWQLSIERLKEALRPCCDWGVHPAVAAAIAFHLHDNAGVSVTEKLRLASDCGDKLLLIGALHLQCRRESIFQIVSGSPDAFQKIEDGPAGAVVVGEMLRHAAGDGDGDHCRTMSAAYHEQLDRYLRMCAETGNFRLVGEDRSDKSCLLVSAAGESESHAYLVNRAYLSCWSPVFRRMFYSDFADRLRSQPAIRLDDESEKAWERFLQLLHPSYMCALWRLLPVEYRPTGRNERALNVRLERVYAAVFEQDLELLMQVFRLAHKFQVNSLVDFCLLMLETQTNTSLSDKLLLADTYHLPTLMEWCVTKLTTPRTVKNLLVNNDKLLNSLSCNCHKLLLERLLELL